VVVTGTDADAIGRKIVDGLKAPDLRIVFLFADFRLDPRVLASVTARGLAPAPVVGGSTVGVIGCDVPREGKSAIGLGLYGDWARVGVGVATDLSRGALTRSRDAVSHAVSALQISSSSIDSAKHIGITIVDGHCGHEEAFCIGSAATAPGARFVGGCSSAEDRSSSPARPHVWVNGEPMIDAGIVVMLESQLPFDTLRSAHLVPTDVKTVVTQASGRVIHQLDGRPAGARLRMLAKSLGHTGDVLPSTYSFARYIDGVPYMRSMTWIDGDDIHVASAVEEGHVLRLMLPGDLIGTTQKDLATAATRVGGTVGAVLAFSCISRHWEAQARGLDQDLATTYAGYPTAGFQSAGEQCGMLLVNHTLTGLVLGASRGG
jgi:hypothetical protein